MILEVVRPGLIQFPAGGNRFKENVLRSPFLIGISASPLLVPTQVSYRCLLRRLIQVAERHPFVCLYPLGQLDSGQHAACFRFRSGSCS